MIGAATTQTTLSHSLQLGRFVFSATRQVLCDAEGRVIHLRPQSRKLLSVLAQNPGQACSKDDLIEAVWPHVTVSDDSLTQCVADIRKAIADKDRMILRTLPKFGYALHGEMIVDVAAPVPIAPERTADPSQGMQARLLITAIWDHPVFTPKTGPLFERIAQMLSQAGASVLQGGDGLQVQCAHVDMATDLAFKVLDAMRRDPLDRVTVRVGICLAQEVTASQHDLLQDIALFPILQSEHSIILSCAARESLKLGIHHDFEDLGTAEGAASGQPCRAFRITSRLALSPAMAGSFESTLAAIAVLPLTARMAAADHGTLGGLIADDIVAELSPSHELRVIARLSTTNFKIVDADQEQIGDYLMANFVVGGSYVVSGSSLRINLELSDVASKEVVWAERIIAQVADVTEGTTLVAEVAARVRQAISAHETCKALRMPLNSLQNYTLLISAINLMHRLSADDFLRAREILHELVARCPGHPEPLAWMGRWHVLRVQQGLTTDLQAESDLALSYTARARAIDPQSSLSLSSEGAVLVNLRRDLDEAEHCYSAALDANPNDAYARLLRGMLFAFQGKGEAARDDCELSLQLAPLDPHRFLYLGLTACANLAAEDYPRTLELAQASYRLNRAHASTLRTLAVAQLRMDQRPEAEATVKALMRLQPGLRVSAWLKSSPSGQYAIGQNFADALRDLGVPD